MSKAVAQECVIRDIKLVVQTSGCLVLSSLERENTAIFFKLIHDELVQSKVTRADEGISGNRRVNCQDALQTEGAGCRRQKRGLTGWKIGDARNHRIPRIICQGGDNRRLCCQRSKNIGIRKQRHRVLRIGPQTLVAEKQECLVFAQGEANRSSELLAI